MIIPKLKLALVRNRTIKLFSKIVSVYKNWLQDDVLVAYLGSINTLTILMLKYILSQATA